ncbi:MAG: argininosuccinate lyase [Nitrososphaerota archaeon]
MSFREGRLRRKMDRDAAEYITSLPFDTEIYKEVILINAVHLKMLAKLGYISKEDLVKGLNTLKEMLERPINLDNPLLEDIHIVVEDYLSRQLPNAGLNLALGKSRNDAVATAIRMHVKEKIVEIVDEGIQLIESLLRKAQEEASTVFPVYTHLQVAAPATFGFIMSFYASRMISALESLTHAYMSSDQCPLGAGAVCGSSIMLDREWMASQLGFSYVLENALDASSSRDFLIDLLSAILKLALPITDMSEELVLYSSGEYGLIVFPDEYSSTSSIMPHKKNPVVAEIGRTKVSEIASEFLRIIMIMQRKVSGYVLDLQQITPGVWRAINHLLFTLRIYKKMIPQISINKERAYELCRPPVAMTELANYLTTSLRIPYRTAHKICGEATLLLIENKLTDEAFREVLKSHGVDASLTVQEVLSILEPKSVVSSYKTMGSANPYEVSRMISHMEEELEELKSWVKARKENLASIDKLVFESF